MAASAVLMTLTAALVHAGWNQLVAKSGKTHPRTAVAMLVGSAAFLPFALADFRIEARAWLFIGPSVVCELAYFGVLAAAYERAPMGVVYPVARGSAPVGVLLVSVALGESVGAPSLLGIALVLSGILLVRGMGRAVRLRHVLLALSIGALIAAYTLVDAAGLRYASPLTYLEIVLAPVALVYAVFVARRSGVPVLRSVVDWRTGAAGVGIFASYGLVLVALSVAPAAPVAALRETGVVMAVLLLAVTGQEPITRSRAAGAVLVSAGVACILL